MAAASSGATSSAGALPTSSGDNNKETKNRRRFSLQAPVHFINKMGRKLSVGNWSGSLSGSMNNLSTIIANDPDQTSKWGGDSSGRNSRSRARRPGVAVPAASLTSVNTLGSEEELNLQFADFDTYMGGFDDPPPPKPAVSRPVVPIILLPSGSSGEDDADQREEPDKSPARQRSSSETRPGPAHFSRFLKFNRRRSSQSENPSPTSLSQFAEFPMPYERRGSFQGVSTLGVATPALKCSLEQLPEGVQVHHATRTCTPSPDIERQTASTIMFSSSSSVHSDPSTSLADESSSTSHWKTSKFRARSATSSSSSSGRRLVRPVQRERSVSFSTTPAHGPLLPESIPNQPADQKKRRSLGYLFWPPFGRSR